MSKKYQAHWMREPARWRKALVRWRSHIPKLTTQPGRWKKEPVH
jgi:hypothetical protein